MENNRKDGYGMEVGIGEKKSFKFGLFIIFIIKFIIGGKNVINLKLFSWYIILFLFFWNSSIITFINELNFVFQIEEIIFNFKNNYFTLFFNIE